MPTQERVASSISSESSGLESRWVEYEEMRQDAVRDFQAKEQRHAQQQQQLHGLTKQLAAIQAEIEAYTHQQQETDGGCHQLSALCGCHQLSALCGCIQLAAPLWVPPAGSSIVGTTSSWWFSCGCHQLAAPLRVPPAGSSIVGTTSWQLYCGWGIDKESS